jgi:RNA polymerase sigma-70 factor (ECF subfamily)
MVVPEDATDEALASRAALGDSHAFDEITIRYQDRVYRLACRLVGHDDAPDVVQEGFLSVYRNLASFRHESRFGTWLYRIITNAALMHRRARTRRPVESLETFLPEFDETGHHRHTPAELQVAACANELLDRRLLRKKQRLPSSDCPTSIAVRLCCVTWKSSPPLRSRTCSAWSRRRCASASTVPA